MSWWFTLPLVIALLIAFIFRNSTDDLRHLADSGTLLNLLLSLILAPWQIKIVLLILILWRSRELLGTLEIVQTSRGSVSPSSSLNQSEIHPPETPSPPQQIFENTESISGKVTLPKNIKYRHPS